LKAVARRPWETRMNTTCMTKAMPDRPHGLAGASSLAAARDLFNGPDEIWVPGGMVPYPTRRVSAGTMLVIEGAPARSMYVVQAGHFKILRTDEDGFEQVLDFAQRMDVLGMDGLDIGTHLTGAEALEDSTVFAIPATDLHALCSGTPAFAARLLVLLSRQAAHMAEIAWLMAAVSADIRTARFVLHVARRAVNQGGSATRLHLPMCRRDIASYLGLAHESVSRSMTQLAGAGLLRVDNRDIEILDAPGLQRFARATRRRSGEL
jgi:CRP/FNR family transcriptional regulator